jgi:hypothetical protein
MKRPYPIHFAEYYAVAKELNLSCPKGHALYACNRDQMGWPMDYEGRRPIEWVLSRCQHATAQRWLRHWNNGGHIRSLQHTVAEWNTRRRADDRERYERQGKPPYYTREEQRRNLKESEEKAAKLRERLATDDGF